MSGGSSLSTSNGSEENGQTGSSSSGSSGSGQTVGTSDSPSAINGGITSQLDLPALGTADKATPASSSARPFVMWAAGAIIALGLAVLYLRRPRAATPA